MEVINQNVDTITNIFDPLLKKLTPSGGAYLNEVGLFDNFRIRVELSLTKC